LNENHPEQFALRLREAFWELRIIGYGALIILRSAARLCYFALCRLQTTDMKPAPLAPTFATATTMTDEDALREMYAKTAGSAHSSR
jgi:hypothetical protein